MQNELILSKVIEKAITACKNSGAQVENHFRDATIMVKIGSGAERQIDDIMLTRYACYLEELPPDEDLKILERRIKSSENKMIKGTGLPKN